MAQSGQDGNQKNGLALAMPTHPAAQSYQQRAAACIVNPQQAWGERRHYAQQHNASHVP